MEKFVTDSLIPGWLNVTKELENGRTEVFWKTWDDAQQDFLSKLTFISEALAGWLVLLHLAEMLKSHDRFSCCCRDQFNFCSQILTRFCSKVLSGLGGRKGRTRDRFSFFSLVLKSTWPLNPNVPTTTTTTFLKTYITLLCSSKIIPCLVIVSKMLLCLPSSPI